MFEQAELQGTQMCPNGPPNAEGTAYIAPEIAIYRKPGLWGHFWPFCPKWPFWSFWPAISEPGWIRRGESLTWSHACINETELRLIYKLDPPEARPMSYCRGFALKEPYIVPYDCCRAATSTAALGRFLLFAFNLF